MLENPPVLTIKRIRRRPSTSQISIFESALTGHIVDCMDGRGAMNHLIKPHDPSIATISGPALTCLAYPADNLGLIAALHIAQPGDVIVCSNDAYKVTAVVGDLICGMMKNKGIAALVTDGMIRDQIGIKSWRLPIFCQGITPNSPARTGPGSVGLPITIGGLSVETGDMVVCDVDGVAVVPFSRIDEVAEKLAKLRTDEIKMEAQVRAGMTEPNYISKLMKSPQVHYID